MRFEVDHPPLSVYHDNGAYIGKIYYDSDWDIVRFKADGTGIMDMEDLKQIIKKMKKVKQ